MPLKVLTEARACTVCEPSLPLGARPLLAGSSKSKVLIIGQAPGQVAHESGIPWDDTSGDRLRDWLGIDRDLFYDERFLALMPLGFCFPGKGKTGDLPPRPGCAPLWHDRLLKAFKSVQLTIFIGRHATDHYLCDQYRTLLDAASAFDDLLPTRIVLPHPSGRNNIWLKKNPWFESKLLPRLRTRVAEVGV